MWSTAASYVCVDLKKIKARIFDGPQVRLLIKDSNFTDTIQILRRRHGMSLFGSNFQQIFLANKKSSEYSQQAEQLMSHFQRLDAS